MASSITGTIYTFYSYKGGVGRSMAVANVATLLAQTGRKVLILDWDLEAPGLHKFFSDCDRSLNEKVRHNSGILDFLLSVKRGQILDWRKCVISIKISGSLKVDFISAGRVSPEYATKLQEINWQELYDEYDIGGTLEAFRSDCKANYDIILVDSRTGVTDIGDICTAILPDILVCVFVSNEQNIEGIKYAVDRARKVHQNLPNDRTRLLVVPLLSRDEIYTEYDLSSRWRRRLASEMQFVLTDWLPKTIPAETFFQKIFLPYFSYWSYGESLPVLERPEELDNPASLGSAYGRISALIGAHLDWSVLDSGVNPQEVESLRARVNRGMEETAEAKAALNETKRALSGVKRSWSAITVVATLVGALGAGAGAAWFAKQSESASLDVAERARLDGLLRESEQARNDLSSRLDAASAKADAALRTGSEEAARARDEAQRARVEAEKQRSEMSAQIAHLTQQNAELLRRIESSQLQYERFNRETQQKLDDTLRELRPHVPYRQ